MIKFNVIEDNGGGITLFVFDINGNVIYGHTGYEFQHGQIKEDIKELESMEYGDDFYLGHWGDDCEEKPQSLYDMMMSEPTGYKIIADENGIYPELMGISGEDEFSTEEE